MFSAQRTDFVYLPLCYSKHFYPNPEYVWKGLPFWLFLLWILTPPQPIHTEASDRESQWRPDLDRSCPAQFHCEPLGLRGKVGPRGVCPLCLGCWLSWEGQGHALQAGYMLHFGGQCAREDSHPHKHSACVTLRDRGVGVLSGGLLLECWLPSYKVLLPSNSNS